MGRARHTARPGAVRTVTGGGSLGVQTAAALVAAALMVVAGLGKHRLVRRPLSAKARRPRRR